MGYRTTRRQLKAMQQQEQQPEPEPSTLVISRWLNLCQVGHWTPFEAATEITKALDKAGYIIVRKPARG